MNIESDKALDHVKTFLTANGGLGWADALVATLGGLPVEGVDRAIHRAADDLYAGLLREQPAFAFAMTTAFVSIVHERIAAKLSAQVAKPTHGRSPWQRWQLQ
jgi:hypothetical protein